MVIMMVVTVMSDDDGGDSDSDDDDVKKITHTLKKNHLNSINHHKRYLHYHQP
jgi:hypothetical protein